jgi:hypothetical protein
MNPNCGVAQPAQQPEPEVRQWQGGQGRNQVQTDTWKQEAAPAFSRAPVYPSTGGNDNGLQKQVEANTAAWGQPQAPQSLQPTPAQPPQPAPPTQNTIGGGAYGGNNTPKMAPGLKAGGKVKAFAKGGAVKSSRGDGIAQRGKTRGKMV